MFGSHCQVRTTHKGGGPLVFLLGHKAKWDNRVTSKSSKGLLKLVMPGNTVRAKLVIVQSPSVGMIDVISNRESTGVKGNEIFSQPTPISFSLLNHPFTYGPNAWPCSPGELAQVVQSPVLCAGERPAQVPQGAVSPPLEAPASMHAHVVLVVHLVVAVHGAALRVLVVEASRDAP